MCEEDIFHENDIYAFDGTKNKLCERCAVKDNRFIINCYRHYRVDLSF